MGEEIRVPIQAEWNYDDSEYRRLIADVDTATEKVNVSHSSMDRGSIRTARSVAHLGMTFGHLSDVIARTASGEVDLARSIPTLLSYFTSLIFTIWSVVAAEKARAVAHAAANTAAAGPGAPVMAAIIIAAASAAAVALSALVPSRQAGGPIFRTGLYRLERGEVYRRGEGGGISVTISGNTITSETLPAISSKLITDLRAAGAI